MVLLQPKIIALDTAHYADIAKDYSSKDSGKYLEVERFCASLADNGYIPILSFSHIEELIRHMNDDVVRKSLKLISSFPLIAWIGSFQYPRVMGSIADILAFEAKEAFEKPSCSVLDVRDRVKPQILQFGSGFEAISPFVEQWSLVRGWTLQRYQRSMDIVAIARSDFTKIAKVKIRDIVNGRTRADEDIALQLKKLTAALAKDVKERGDKRIASPDLTADKFMRSVAERGAKLSKRSVAPVADLLALDGINLASLDPNATFEDVGDIAAFFKKLEVANLNIQLPLDKLKSVVTEDRVPSGVLQAGFRRYGQDHHERKGSELGDTYLACLAPYVDAAFVDKRTLENTVRARRKCPDFASLSRGIVREPSYKEIPALLRRMFN